MRRAGLDYHEYAGLSIYENWEEFRDKQPRARLFGLSTKGSRFYTEVTFENGDFLVFGPETRGLPESIRAEICLLYTSPSPRDGLLSRMPSSA